ncbi:SDR family NAD(P)-dependent oxidoreductase [Phenylobacterium montanum]|uniref:D-xylose 1-dehydrogenase n=1 Tax=Phenylobacterium montanum TaxID=2823693 RepID=A0A975G2J1_9CAUL|nr:SDR family NAD(P)-dependent oxidoreductase [Caulobacter sp. S6]QUD89362.1 SDR family NAD(P)-dependent oxidoreductase [Caulobacter sp. S6]
MTSTPFDLTGRVALVTGASSGIGHRLALDLARAGAKVVVAARRTDRLESLVAEIKAAGGDALAVAMDVAVEASVSAGYNAAEAAFGPVDTVYANAGMSIEGLAVDLPVEAFDQIMAINVRGVFLTAREGARRMMKAGSKQSRRGRIVLVASMGAHKVLPGLTAYCTSKAAVAMMGRSLAREWANQGINVNVICPGYLETELNSDWFHSEGGQKQITTFPRRRLMSEGDLDPILLYLGADASSGTTGSLFNIDDGQSL